MKKYIWLFISVLFFTVVTHSIDGKAGDVIAEMEAELSKLGESEGEEEIDFSYKPDRIKDGLALLSVATIFGTCFLLEQKDRNLLQAYFPPAALGAFTSLHGYLWYDLIQQRKRISKKMPYWRRWRVIGGGLSLMCQASIVGIAYLFYRKTGGGTALLFPGMASSCAIAGYIACDTIERTIDKVKSFVCRERKK